MLRQAAYTPNPTRYSLALSTAGDKLIPLSIVAENLLLATLESESEGKDPSTDPSVMLIGMQVAFLTHSDVTTQHTYDRLIAACQLNQPQIVPDKEKH